MWSPTDSADAGRGTFRADGRRQAVTGRTAAFLFLVFLCGVILDGCAGYRLASETPSVLGDGGKTLKVKGVDYPTLQPWLPFAIRSRLRDEVNSRYLAKWVDSGSADYEIQINVISFTTRQWMRSELDTTVLYDSTMIIEAIIYEGSTNKEVWRSGKISYADRAEKADEKSMSGDLITQVMRMLADRMRNTF